MTAAPQTPSAAPRRPGDREVVALLPTPGGLFPPVTGARLRRTLVAYTVLWMLGALPGVVNAGPGVRAAGLGLVLPGGGLYWAGHPVAAGVALALTAFSVLVWWAIGSIVLPPIVWTATAVWGAVVAAGETPSFEGTTGRAVTVLVVVPATVALLLAVHAVRHRYQARRGAALNTELATRPFLVTGAPPLGTPIPVQESTVEDLEHLRYALDLALQPVDRFDGFVRADQFREAALRYAIYLLGYSLSIAQFTRTPAFSGYLAEAQRSAVEKVLQRKVWGYWAIENAWGNLSLDRDPVGNGENVMLTGYHGLQVALYETLNDDRYSRAGSLTYRWDDGHGYANDLGTLTDALRRNFSRSAFGCFPCEPNWVYPICNAYGVNAVQAHDRLYGTTHFSGLHERLRTAYETEFLRPDGTIVGVRNTHLGFSWNFWAGPTIQLATAYWLHGPFPELARRAWWLLRREYLSTDADGLVRTPWTASGRLDPGNYTVGRDLYTLAAILGAARELGDDEYADAAERTLARRAPTETSAGARRYSGASPLTNCWSNLGRFGRHSAMRDLVAFGVPEAWRRGPRLVGAAYPDVLVARAVTDGAALDLVLRPGAGPTRTVLTIAGLQPGRTYRASGAVEDEVAADARSEATVTVDLDGRREVRVF